MMRCTETVVKTWGLRCRRRKAYIPAMTRLQHRSKLSFGIVVLAGITLAACSSRSEPNTEAAQGNGGGNASAIKACDLLTLDDIKQATGATMTAGKLQTTNSQASCDWSSADDSSGASGVGVIVQDFDNALWQNMSASPHAVPVAGVGEQAFKGVPHSGDLSVKKGKYEVDVAIVDFKHDNATVDAATLKLMNLVLARL
jgi:hypothetical protein